MPAVGDKAPDFRLMNQDEKVVRLGDFKGKTIVLFAFPKANTSG
jgi:peroxiredoxin Q/BCP